MLFWYEYYTDSVFAESYEEACEYFAERHADFDAEEVWQDEDED